MKKILLLIGLIVSLAVGAFAQAALDPSRLAVGGRALGLGRTYVGLADDVTSVFLNPAGLASIPQWQMTSMAGKFAEEYSYLLLNGAYPTKYGVFGLSFVGASTGGVPVTKTLDGTQSDPIYVIDYSQDFIDYYNNVYFLTWAKDFPEILGRKIDGDLEVGINLKIFNVSLTGDGIIDGQGTGTEIDLGIKYRPLPYVGLGAVGRNILPYSMGGKLTYGSGYSEFYPAAYHLGASVNVLGKAENSIYKSNHDLIVLFDTEYNYNMPMVMHYGAEWKPMPIIALRVGVDQDVSSDNSGNLVTESGMSYGVGLLYGGFRFDYAFHQFPGLPGINNSFFSLSYGLDEKKPPLPKVPLEVNAPPDKLITFEASQNVVGRVIDPRVNALYVNGIKIRFDLKGDFNTQIDQQIGKNVIQVNARADKTLIAEERVRILRLKTFPDVPISYWVAEPVSLLAMQGIISGYPNGDFKPEGNITRAEMCTLLMKANEPSLANKEELFPNIVEFKDVSDNHWASKYIAEAAELGIVKGYPDGTFKPKNNITRAEGLAMIVRFAKLKEWAYAGEFSDVPYEHWAASLVASAKKAGMLQFLAGRRFQPSKKLNRAETVELLYQTPFMKDVLSRDLLNWDSY